MIAKSDMVILVVSASLLAVGIYRWQSNVSRIYDNRVVSSSPAIPRADSSQQSDASTLATRPDTATAGDTSAAGTQTSTPVQTNSGNQQSATQSAAGSAGNSSPTGTTTDQSGTRNGSEQPLYGTYEVKSGDTLSKIAVDYDTTVDELRSLNDISGSLINVGQTIRYPLPAN